MSRSFHRPENALKRANEFIDVEKPGRALEVLYEVIKRGKMRNSYSEKLLEPIMFKYLELCVDLKKSHLAKEGLYQYRNIFQSVNVSSLETVVKHYLRLAEERTEEARKESHQAVVDIDDLDNLATPEEILLSAVSGEDAQDRSDRTILTPWVKFLWESYRQCLELLRTNSRVERLYHDIAKQAFKFCEKYSRKTEFRKLCENLRIHLANIQKQQGSATAVNLNNPETQQMNLETRLEQLNYAIVMELWQEAYKAIEDISDLMNKSKKMPKPHVMASYYQKLSMVFWKAGNLLFHAAALFKLFQLLRDQKKNITADELEKRASVVLVATLAIPLPSTHPEFDRFIETEKSAIEKVDRLAALLSLPKPPTRVSLVRDLARMNVVTSVSQELQDLYHLMEVEFDPLNLCHRVKKHLDFISNNPETSLVQYVPDLQTMTITRLIKQVSQVYQSITFKKLQDMSVFVTAFQLERILVDLVRHNDLQIRIDHKEKSVHFGADLSESQREDLPEGPTLQALPSETIRCQLVHMSSALQKCLAIILPEAKKKEMEPVRAQTIQNYKQTMDREHFRILQRQHIIEERKEMLENQNLEREESIRRAQEETLKRQKDEEQERLVREASIRERQRQAEQLKQIQTKQIKDKLQQISQTSYGQKMIEKLDEKELMNLDAEEILQRQVEELEKERKELQQRLKAQERKVDYMERAKRLVEIPRFKKMFDDQKEKDRECWQAQEEERVKKLVEEHTLSLAHSKRLKRMNIDKDGFLENLKAARRSEIEKELLDFNARLEVEKKKRMKERKDQRRQERKQAYLKAKAEAEQQRIDEELKKQREEDERKEQEEREREEENYKRRIAELERQSEMQKQREREMEEKMNKPYDGDGQSQSWRPGSGGWRERERAKLDAWKPNRTDDETASADGDSKQSVERDDDKEPKRGEPDRDFRRGEPDRDFRRGEPDRDFRRDGQRDIRRDGGGARDFRRDGDGDRDFRRGGDGDRGDFKRGGDGDRGDFRRGGGDGDRGDFRRGGGGGDRDFRRDGGGDRDFRRGDGGGDRDFRRGDGGGDRDFRRGDGGGDRDFRRGDGGGDRDFRRGDGGGDRDFRRGDGGGDRDFRRGDGGGDRDFRRGDGGGDREFRRGGGGDRDFRRDGGGEPREIRREGGSRFGPSRDIRRDEDFIRNEDKNESDWRGSNRGGGRFGGRDREDREGDRRDDRRGGGNEEGSSWRSGGGAPTPAREDRGAPGPVREDRGAPGPAREDRGAPGPAREDRGTPGPARDDRGGAPTPGRAGFGGAWRRGGGAGGGEDRQGGGSNGGGEDRQSGPRPATPSDPPKKVEKEEPQHHGEDNDGGGEWTTVTRRT